MMKKTDENVIPFRGLQAQPSEEQRAALVEKQREQSSTWVRSKIEAKFDKRPMVQSKPERMRLAHNLWQILSDVRQLGVSTKDVLHAAGQGHGTDSTKRLCYCALNPNLPHSIQEKRADKLAKHVKAYAKIAIEAAQGENPLSLIQRLVDGTFYALLGEEPDDIDTDIKGQVLSDVETAIQTAGARITSKYNLQRFFTLVDHLGIKMNYWGSGRWDAEKISPPALIDNDRLPPCPSVHLGDVLVCDDIRCTLSLFTYEPKEKDEDRTLYERVLDTGHLNESFEGVATPVLRASLELLPVGRQNAVTPILHLEPWTYIALAEDFTGFAALGGSNWRAHEIVDRFPGPVEKFAEGGDGHLAAIDLGSEISVEVDIQVEFGSDVGAEYVNSLHSKSSFNGSWILRFDGSVRDLLNKEMFTPYCVNQQTKHWFPNLDFNPEGIIRRKARSRSSQAGDLIPFPDNMMAALLEHSLFHAPEEAGLDHLLDEKARILTQELDEKIERARARRHERLDELRRK
jgi:hypothetical protein